MSKVTLRRQGNSVGVTFPADTRVRMGFEVGQDLPLVELADGVKLVTRNLALERQSGARHRRVDRAGPAAEEGRERAENEGQRAVERP